jgi:putative colanic acid biosynthesis acetyltransferase WcaF
VPYTQPSFSLGNRLARALWGMVWLLLFRPSPRPFHAWRRLLLRLFGAELGVHVNIYPSVQIWAPWQLNIGNRVGIANGVTLYNMAPIVIGDNCVISQGAHLCCGTHDIDSPNFQLMAKPIILEGDVWICAEAFVGPGITIAEGCVLGARAVVTKTITEPWSVWVGNPALRKRTRKVRAKE